MAAFYSNSNVDNSHNWPLIVEVRQLTAVIQSKSKIITDDLLTIMDILPDEILVGIFLFIDFKQRIMLRTVSWRWSQLLYDCTLLQEVSIRNTRCEDHQLKTLFTATKRVMVIDFFNSFQLTGSCLLHAALSRLRHLTLTGTAISDDILNRILHACSNELMELHLAGTRLSDQCLPCIVALKKLKYISVPREDAHGFGKRAALEIVQRCPTLRTFDCQEGYLFDGEEISQIVHANPKLTGLLIPYAFIADENLILIIESLANLTHLCVCETGVSRDCVQRMRSLKTNLEICWNENHTP